MAHPQSCSSRGDDDDDFAEYDPTPFSGGYDQAAIYGQPKPPSEETCHPISDAAGEEHVECEYGNERPPYLPGKSSSHGGGYVDEQRPTNVPETPPHHSDEGFESGYGRPKPNYGGGYGQEDDQGFGSGYGRPKPKPKPASFFESGESYGGGEESFESGDGKPKPSYGGQFEQEDSYERPPPQGGEEGFEYGYAKPKPTCEPEDSYDRPPPPPHGRPHRQEESYDSSYGGGFGASSYGVRKEEGQESYGGYGEGEYGREKPSGYGKEEGEESGFEFGGRRRQEEGEEEGGFGSSGRWKHGEEGGFGSGRRRNEEDEYGSRRPGYGRGGYNEETGGYGDIATATEGLSLDSEGYGGYGRQGYNKDQKHHRRDDYDEE